MGQSILRAGRSYTFSDYFDLAYPTEEVVAEFGYRSELRKLLLPRAGLTRSPDQLQATLYRRLPHISLTSETARREALVAPILMELLDHLEAKLDIEYPLYVSQQLRGNLDYLVRSQEQFIVVEAKKADMERGFTQLAVELIALDQRAEGPSERIYGAITVGDIWRFGVLDRAQKIILKDIDLFRVPMDLADLFKVLLGILQPAPVTAEVAP